MSETAVRERPILFKSEMVRALIEGRKTQTRRMVPYSALDKWTGRDEHLIDLVNLCRYGGIGDRLWVKTGLFDRKVDTKLWLEIQAVRVQRLQCISEKDAIAEGAQHGNVAGTDVDIDGEVWNGAYYRAFASLWDRINGNGSWRSNPWVWAITFKPLTPPQPSSSAREGAEGNE